MATVKRECVVCGTPFTSANPRKTTCGNTCRSRKHRGAVISIAPSDAAVPAAARPELGGVLGATYRELEAAERLETAYGQAAMVLARRIDVGRDTGSAMATMTRQLRDTLAEALKGARREGSKLDELTAKRQQRLGRGA